MRSDLTVPLSRESIESLHVGDIVYLNGLVYTARDMAHLKICSLLRDGETLPEQFDGSAIFHAGPVAQKDGNQWVLRAIGPTTSMRMEPYADLIGRLGIRAIIGKGGMGERTRNALKAHGAVYLLAAPGCAVKHTECFECIERVHWFEELGMPEAMWVLRAKSWGPLIVGMDAHGNSVLKDISDKAVTLVPELVRDWPQDL